jgi:hypothetical protein
MSTENPTSSSTTATTQSPTSMTDQVQNC